MVAALVLSVGCSQPYGRQSCKTSKDCGSGQFCPPLCAPDAGPGVVDQSAICAQACSVDDDCANLGLKKPKCVTDLCAGGKTCADVPF